MDRLWRQKRAKYHGLVNQGATCYLNSVLQVLFMTEDFRDTVKRYNAKEHIDRELRDLFKDLVKCNAKTNNITKKLKIQDVREQRDAAEHYEKVLRLTSPEASKIFHGELMNYNTCKECKTKTGSAAAFWSLPLPLVNSDNYYSVEEGIEDYFRPSEITGDDQMYCEKCDEKRDAVLHCEVSHQPDVLVLLLKRFEFDYRYMTYVKINQPVVVPHTVKIPQQQNNQNQTYNLYAFVEHFGELRYGHYISTIWSQEDDGWYIFDDTNVKQLKTSPTLEGSQSAYLLFYRKQLKAVNEDPAPASPVKATRKRSFGNSEDKPVEEKKPKQEPSDEEPPLEQTGQKSPDNQDLDEGGCSSGQQMLNTAEANQDDDSRSDQSPNKDQWSGPDQSEPEALFTGDLGNLNGETPMKAGGGEQFNLCANYGIGFRNGADLRMEVKGAQEEREERYSINPHIGDGEQIQRDVCKTSDKNCCEGNGGSESLQVCSEVNVEQLGISGMGRCYKEEAAKTIEDDFSKRFQRQDFSGHQICNPEKAAANWTMQSCKCSADDCIIVIEPRDLMIVDSPEIKPPCALDTEQPIQMSPNQQNAVDDKGGGPGQSESEALCTQHPKSATCETGENAGDGKHGVGEEFDLGGSFGIEQRRERALKTQVQSGPEGREESYSVKSEHVDDVQNQRNVCKNSDKTCCGECTGGCEGLQSCPDADMPAVNVRQRGSKAKVLLEMRRDSEEKVVKTIAEDAESSELKMFTMSQSNNNECVQEQVEDPPGIRNGHEPIDYILASENDAFQETAKQTELNQDILNEDELNTSGRSSESCKNGIENGKSSQEKELYESNDKGAIENVSSDCAGATGVESVQRGYTGVTNAYEEPNPCFSVSENQKDLAQSPITMKKEVAEAHSGKNDQREDTGKLERMEGANLLDNGVSMGGQGRTGSGGAVNVKLVESGSTVERRLTIYHDLYLSSVQNPPKLYSYDKQSTRAKSGNQKVPEAKRPGTEYYHSTAKSGIVESERFEHTSMGSSRSDKESEQREIADQVEGQIETLQPSQTGFERVDKITEGDTEIIKITVNKRQSGNDERQNRRSDMCSVQSDKNAETLADGVDCLTISKEEDVGIETTKEMYK